MPKGSKVNQICKELVSAPGEGVPGPHEAAPGGHQDSGEIDSGLWAATLLDPPHDIEGTENEIEAFNPWRAKHLRDYPLQAAYEEFLEDYFEDGIQNELACHQFILMEDLRLAWWACKAIFNEQATPEVAWKIYLETKKEAADYARLLAGKEEGDAQGGHKGSARC